MAASIFVAASRVAEALGILLVVVAINYLGTALVARAAKADSAPGIGVTESLSLSRTIRPYAKGIPGWAWELLTWAIFANGYFIKTALSMGSLVFYISWVEHDCFVESMAGVSTGLQSFSRSRSRRNTFDMERFQTNYHPGMVWQNQRPRATQTSTWRRVLECLPQRTGQRPIVGGIAPQRQLDQRNSKEVFDNLLTSLDHFAAENVTHLCTADSFLEKKTKAILAHCDCVTEPIFRTFGCEVVHPHHVDGSLHVVLHPGDIRTVIEAGWGERHPIARAERWWCWWFFTFEERPPVPEYLCFTYAPRTHFEVGTVMSIVDAGARFVAGEDAAREDTHLSCPNHCPRPTQREY